MRKLLVRSILALIVLVSSVEPGLAQTAPAGAQPPPALPGEILRGAALDADGQGVADPSVSTITSGRSGAARKLAQTYPAEQRAAVERMFEALLQAYPQIERAAGVPAGDMAGALALFALSNLEAYRDADVDSKYYKPVIDQLRRALQSSPGFARTSVGDRRELYEQMAIVGMFVVARRADARKSGDQAALRTVRDSAGQYISQWFKVEPDRLQVGSRGLFLATSAGAPSGPATAAPEPPAATPPRPGRFATDRLAAVLSSWQQRWKYGTYQYEQTAYILLVDGTCTTALPTRLEDLDPAASRAAHPKQWGRWRRRGRTYEVAIDGAFEAPPNQKMFQPARRGERLDGNWTLASSGTVGSTSFWSTDAVVFGKDGRFEASSSGGMGGTIEGGRPGESTTTTTIRNDEGSSSSITSPHVAGGATRRTGKTRADRAGTYSLDGYTLELRYDSGLVERHLFFAAPDRRDILFRGSLMWRKKT